MAAAEGTGAYGGAMDLLTYAYDTAIVQVDDHAVEVFRRAVTASQRLPLQWVAVGLIPNRKGDQIEVRIGTSTGDATPFYDSNVVYQGAFSFTVPSSEESRLREFFDQVASRAGRTT